MNQRAPESRSDTAYRLLLGLIESESLVDGSRLPSEVELVKILGLSRASIRDALARLRADGKAISRRGSGTFTITQNSQQLVKLSVIDSIQDLIDWHEFRLALESEVAALAAERRTEADLTALRRAQDKLVEKLSDQFAVSEDAAFHAAIAQCAHNPPLIEAVGRLATHIFRWNQFTSESGIFTLSERRELISVEHGDIVTAISEGDPARARSMLRRHLLNGRARLIGRVIERHQSTGRSAGNPPSDAPREPGSAQDPHLQSGPDVRVLVIDGAIPTLA